MPVTQVTQTRVPTFRRVPNLAWLESPAPSYLERLPWPHRQPYDDAQPPAPLPVTNLGWLGPQQAPPTTTKGVPFLKATPGPDPAPEVAPAGPRPWWLTSPQPSYAETAVWLHRQPFDDAQPPPPLRVVNLGWLGRQQAPPVFDQTMGFLRRAAPPPDPAPDPGYPAVFAAPWFSPQQKPGYRWFIKT